MIYLFWQELCSGFEVLNMQTGIVSLIETHQMWGTFSKENTIIGFPEWTRGIFVPFKDIIEHNTLYELVLIDRVEHNYKDCFEVVVFDTSPLLTVSSTIKKSRSLYLSEYCLLALNNFLICCNKKPLRVFSNKNYLSCTTFTRDLLTSNSAKFKLMTGASLNCEEYLSLHNSKWDTITRADSDHREDIVLFLCVSINISSRDDNYIESVLKPLRALLSNYGMVIVRNKFPRWSEILVTVGFNASFFSNLFVPCTNLESHLKNIYN